jgi:hypothetical protein
VTRPSGEFGSTLEVASLTSEAPWLTGPLQNLSSLNNVKSDKDQPVFIVYDVQLAAGASFTCFCESGIPDEWIVTVRPANGLKISLFINPNNSGIPIRLTGGGYAQLPGMSEYLTVLCEVGSTGTSVTTVIAVRGYKHVEVYGGNLA